MSMKKVNKPKSYEKRNKQESILKYSCLFLIYFVSFSHMNWICLPFSYLFLYLFNHFHAVFWLLYLLIILTYECRYHCNFVMLTKFCIIFYIFVFYVLYISSTIKSLLLIFMLCLVVFWCFYINFFRLMHF